MKLGAFSISLPVSDIAASMEFYARIGFTPMVPPEEGATWVILTNPDGHIIGLFKGMFDRPMLTFNPGWDQGAAPLPEFEDVRELHASVVAAGGAPEQVALDAEAGPGSFVLVDPDGHPVLIDQHR